MQHIPSKGPILFRDHANIIKALADAYEITENKAFLTKAEAVLKLTNKNFYDKKANAFNDIAPDKKAFGLLKIPRKNINDNSTLILALLKLYKHTKKQVYLTTAQGIANYFSGIYKRYGPFASKYALAVMMLLKMQAK